MTKATVAKGKMHCEKYDKSEEKPQGQCSNLFNLSSHCRRSYKTFSAVPCLFDCSYFVFCYFMLTPSKCCARNSILISGYFSHEHIPPYKYITDHTTLSFLLPENEVASLYLYMVKRDAQLQNCSLSFYCGMKTNMAHRLKFSIAATPPKNTTLLDEYDVKWFGNKVL